MDLLDPKSEGSGVSELKAAACLLDLHAKRLTETPVRPAERTWDFTAEWQDDYTIEVEVTKRSKPSGQGDLRQRAKELAMELEQRRAAAHLLLQPLTLYATSLEDEIIVSELLDAAVLLHADNPFEQRAGRWSIRLGAGDDPRIPGWWPQKLPLTLARFTSSEIAGQPAMLWIGYGASTATYLRAIRNKAKHFQGSDLRPFLIAHDCHDIVNGVEVLKRDVRAEIDTWSRIDGVLLFKTARHDTGRIGWLIELIQRPDGRRFPDQLVRTCSMKGDSTPRHHFRPPQRYSL